MRRSVNVFSTIISTTSHVVLAILAVLCCSDVQAGEQKGGGASSQPTQTGRDYGDELLGAIKHVRLDDISQILKHFDVNTRLSQTGMTAISCAARKKEWEPAVRLLLKHGADPNGRRGRVPIYGAALNGNTAIVRILLKAGADPNRRDFGDSTALNVISSREIAKLLIQRGANVNSRTDKNRIPKRLANRTPLHYAAATGKLEVAELLIKHGASINPLEGTGKTPLDYAKDPKMVALLKKHGGKPGRPSSVEGEKGKRDNEAEKVLANLLRAIKFDKLEDAEQLIAKLKGRKNANRWRARALLFAAGYGKEAAVDSLLKHGADPDGNPEDSPILAAVLEDCKGVVRALLKAGANPNPREKDGGTPLHGAGSAEIAEMLIRSGADVNARVSGKRKPAEFAERTPLHYATEFGRLGVAVVLIKHGAAINPIEGTGKTPLDYAKDPKMVALLKKHGGKLGRMLSEVERKVQGSATKKPEAVPGKSTKGDDSP